MCVTCSSRSRRIDLQDRDGFEQAVADLTDAGSSGFHASAVARQIGSVTEIVAPALLGMVKRGQLKLRFDLLCPDNGRTITSFDAGDQLPIGQEWQSDRCDSPEPFVVERAHIWVVFVPTESYRIHVRRRHQAEQRQATRESGDPPGLERCRTPSTRTSAAGTSRSTLQGI